MSKVTKRKHVRRKTIEDEVRPTGDQIIVRVTCGRGNNLHEVESCDGSRFLVSMPVKFRASVWIKRGDYVVVEPIREGNKVRAEIIHILYSMQIKDLKQEGLWPSEFTESSACATPSLAPPTSTQASSSAGLEQLGSTSEDSDDDTDLFQNTNHPQNILTSSSEESDH